MYSQQPKEKTQPIITKSYYSKEYWDKYLSWTKQNI